MGLQISICSTDNTCPFSMVNAGRGAAVGRAASIAHLDEYQDIRLYLTVMGHDEINLTKPAGKIPRDESQPFST